MSIRFIMLGGFLGAGKTTAIARLARHYTQQGLRVGLVTNDQAYDLVDTQSLRAQGFDVGEVPGACFCCKFDDLVDVARQLDRERAPQVIITEPVGSCTDLAATVIEPLRHLHGDRYSIAPLAVLLKPEHGRKILGEGRGAGFSPQAAYIFLKQLEEADLIVLNKTDKLTSEQRHELLDLIGQRFPGRSMLAISARTGDGFERLTTALEGERRQRPAMEVDYDVYAAGEAELGWLNCQAEFTSQAAPISLDELAVGIVADLQQRLAQLGAETAHLKVLAQHGDTPAIANLVASGEAAELSLASGATAPRVEVVVNARVAVDPERLEQLVRAALPAQGGGRLACEIRGLQRFRPGRPEPTHRMS